MSNDEHVSYLKCHEYDAELYTYTITPGKYKSQQGLPIMLLAYTQSWTQQIFNHPAWTSIWLN